MDTVTEFITELCGASPISVFKVGASDAADGTTTKPLIFRVCIDEKHSNKFLNPQSWASGIVINRWKFKVKQQERQGTSHTDNGGK